MPNDSLLNYGSERAAGYSIDDVVPPQTYSWYQFWAKRQHANRKKKAMEQMVQNTTPEALLHALSGTGIDFRGQTNLAWQTTAYGAGLEASIDFAQFFLPGSPLTLELKGNVKAAFGSHVLVCTHVMGHRRGETPLNQTPWGRHSPAFADDYFVLLALMRGTYKEISVGIGIEAGIDLSKSIPGTSALEEAGFGIEAKATVGANAGWTGLGYQICDLVPYLYRDLPNKSTYTAIAADYREFLADPKKRREGETYTYVSKGFFFDSTKTKQQPFNSLCSLCYWQSDKAGGIKAEASLGLKYEKGVVDKQKLGVGVEAKVGVSAAAEAKGSAMTASYRAQFQDTKGIVMTQDTIITYKQVMASIGAKLEAGIGVKTGLGDIVDEEEKTRQGEHEKDLLSFEKELKKEWSSNSMTYRSAVTYWPIEYITGTDKYDKDAVRGKENPMYDAIFPRAIMPGSGLQIGQSISLPLLQDYTSYLQLIDYGMAEDTYSPRQIRQFRSWAAGLANALRVSLSALQAFMRAITGAVNDLARDPDASPDALLVEANFNSFSGERTREMILGGQWRNGVPNSIQKVTHSANHPYGEPFLDSKKKNRFKALKDLTDFYENELTTQTTHVRDTIEFVPQKKIKPILAGLQCIRLRYRLGDKANADSSFKLGLNLCVVKFGVELNKIDRVGCEGIFDVHTEWFENWDNGRNEMQQVWPTPACILVCPGGGDPE